MNVWRCDIGVLSFILCVVVGASALADEPAKRKTEEGWITKQLASDDPAAHDAAVARMRELLADRSEQTLNFNHKWVNRLAALRRFEDADQVAIQGIINARTDLMRIAAIQKARAEAFRKAGDMEAALSAAKAYYNLCGMAETEGAINLVAATLARARPDDPDIAQRFKAEQLALAALAQPTTAPASDDEPILKSIVVDDAPFAAMANRLGTGTFSNALSKGNLLLLCDRAAEARQCFEVARDRANGQKQLIDALEGIARSIRAETGSVGAANAFILAQRQGE